MDTLVLEKALNAAKLVLSLASVLIVIVGVAIAYCTVTNKSYEVR